MSEELEQLRSKVGTLEHKISILQRVNDVIAFSGNVEKVLERLLDLTIEFLDVEFAVIYLLRLERNVLKCAVVRSREPSTLNQKDKDHLKGTLLLPGDGLAGHVFEKNICQIVNDTNEDRRHCADWGSLENYPIKNALAVPLIFKELRIGVIELFNKNEKFGGFSEKDIQELSAISNQISIVIENARLHALMNHKLEEMNVLFSAMSLVNSSLKLDDVLDNLMSMAMRIIDAEGCSILLQNLENNTLSFVAASGGKHDEIRNVSLKKGEGIAGWVAEHNESLLIPDVRRDVRFSNRIDQYSGFETQSVLAVPLRIEDTVIGVAEAINKRGGGSFTFNDRRILDTFASTGAMAIQKARLYEDLNELFISTVRSVADAIEAKDPYTRGHSERIRRFSLMIADKLNLDDKNKQDLGLSSLLHDVGKIGVPEAILLKEGKLTEAEWVWMRRHPVIGADMLAHIKKLSNCIPGIRHHQEHYD
ncbi:MAG: GAF domain-containing protein, partial [Elusimicrobia bacterium]|nr:GAF domain-containing protein [Elusimicrobiota bacterium]MBD3411848.1 GAF domain-containing protein [Elusimicrobiota bacterium]